MNMQQVLGEMFFLCVLNQQQKDTQEFHECSITVISPLVLAELCVCVVSRKLIIKCNTYRQAQWWSHEIKRLSETSDFLQLHRFQSFAPPRANTLTKWYVLMGHFVVVFFAHIYLFLPFAWLYCIMMLKRDWKGT